MHLMLRHLTRQVRVWGATLLALSYSLCVLSPAIACAFGDASHAVHCLFDDDHVAASAYIHQSSHGTAHLHADGHHHSGMPEHKVPESNRKTTDLQCCGLAFTNVLPAAVTEVPAPVSSRARTIVEHHRDFADRTPDRLYKPPIFRLSI
jgi:hypothetical protein